MLTLTNRVKQNLCFKDTSTQGTYPTPAQHPKALSEIYYCTSGTCESSEHGMSLHLPIEIMENSSSRPTVWIVRQEVTHPGDYKPDHPNLQWSSIQSRVL